MLPNGPLHGNGFINQIRKVVRKGRSAIRDRHYWTSKSVAAVTFPSEANLFPIGPTKRPIMHDSLRPELAKPRRLTLVSRYAGSTFSA
jgi:hypothetical protein